MAPQRILVIKLSALGDFVQATGPMKAIRTAHPGARITLLTTAPYVAMGQATGWFDEVWSDGRPDWSDLPAVWPGSESPCAFVCRSPWNVCGSCRPVEDR